MMATPKLLLQTRIRLMIAGWGAIGLSYWIGHLISRPAHILHESLLDRLIPFDPSFVWLYLSFFLFVPMAYLFSAPSRVKPLARAMQMSAVFAAVVFVICPTTLVYPAIPSETLSDILMNLLARIDTTQNCLPSLHGALTLLCIVALWQRERPWRSALVLLWGVVIMWAVLQTRRHLVIDLGAGLLLGAACAWLAARQSAMMAASPLATGNP
ncbi:MAG: phosphatase PAP2 family protein, partial [Azoarcus sp.]|nr:phosphatase PAP2 family protein [Azoarcus sp.]